MGASQYYVLTRGAVLRNVVQTRPRHRLAHWSGFSSMMLVLGLLMHFCGPTAPTSISAITSPALHTCQRIVG